MVDDRERTRGLSDPSTWQPIPKARAHEQVLAQIEDHIVSRRLRAGDRLPGERALAQMLGVSRPSVREALRVLEFTGIITSGVGSGPESGSILTQGSTDALGNVLRLHLALANFGVDDVVETRTVIERAAARAAAERATPADVAAMGDLVRRMSERDLAAAEFQHLDSEFHLAVARASQNALLAELMQAVKAAVQQEMAIAFESLPDWRTVAAHLVDEHRQIVHAIESGDADAASAAVEDHVYGFYRTHVGATRG